MRISLSNALLTMIPILVMAGTAMSDVQNQQSDSAADNANQYDRERAPTYAAREADWRCGAIVYQVIVDRFAPPADLDAKRHLYPSPKILHAWDKKPQRGKYLAEVGVWSHEIDFWGGDLQSLRTKLDYAEQLGADVLYLNPIHLAYTNHKYDALDYFEVSPEYGTRADVKALADDLHTRGMRLVLDGVFNHMGKRAAWFTDALENPDSPYRDWFFIGDEYKLGYRAWFNVENLPELRIDNPAVKARIYDDPDSVVQGYLRDGVDGWRLDVAYDLGFNVLHELTQAAHRAKPGSVVIGEIWNYPDEWFPSIDGIMNFHARQIILDLVAGKLSGAHAGRLLARMVEDCGLDPILRSWLMLDNHDTARLKTMLPDQKQRRLAQVLQFTLPGCPNLYYGTEVGMTGKTDPEMRGPMRWERVEKPTAELKWTRQLLEIRKNNRALRVGDFRVLDTEKLLAFQRRTDRIRDLIIVIVNPTDKAVRDSLSTRDAKLMNYADLDDLLNKATVQPASGVLTVEVPPHTAWILRPRINETTEYDPYKRVQ